MNSSPPTARRVLMTADPIGGIWTYVIELSRALAAHGVKIAPATMGVPVSRGQCAEMGSIPNTELFESAYKLERMNQPRNDIDAAGDWLLRAGKQSLKTKSRVGFGKSPALFPKGAPCAS